MGKFKGRYLLTRITEFDPELWPKIKHRAADEDLTYRELILKAIKQYVTEKGNENA